jgi:ankyrin repeat protein
MLAAQRRVPKAVRALIRSGADVNARGPNGTTPLLEAAGAADEESVRALLEAGADPHVRDGSGADPRERALASPARYVGPDFADHAKRITALLQRRETAPLQGTRSVDE